MTGGYETNPQQLSAVQLDRLQPVEQVVLPQHAAHIMLNGTFLQGRIQVGMRLHHRLSECGDRFVIAVVGELECDGSVERREKVVVEQLRLLFRDFP